MISLLTQELNNYDYDNHNQINIKKISNNPFEKKIEKNVENKFKTKSISIKECSLNINSFNPTKNSPPNEWQFRLIKRINSLNSLDNNNN
jgi:hypothetical protein|tara:strand:+ start:769 stop:1038 length:270 start_codon:yes stop_codon:yes gene_type:complete